MEVAGPNRAKGVLASKGNLPLCGVLKLWYGLAFQCADSDMFRFLMCQEGWCLETSKAGSCACCLVVKTLQTGKVLRFIDASAPVLEGLPTNQPTTPSQPTNQPTNHPPSQPTNQPTNRLANQLSMHPTKRATNQLTN